MGAYADFNSHARVGRDLVGQTEKGDFWNFNSHARVGRDRAALSVRHKLVISTHTPAWGVTEESHDVLSYFFDFNSHARVGRDFIFST